MGERQSSESVSELMGGLTRYIHGALAQELPEEVAEKGKHHLLDTLAAMLSGSQMRPGKLAIRHIEKLGGTPTCTVIGSKRLNNPPNAALANGMSGHADETDDSHFRGRFHPGCGIVPGCFAAAEIVDSSGAHFLKSVVLGYDIGVRFNLSLGQTGVYGGGHSTHTVGTLFGASAGAAALMRHNERQIRHQLSYSIQQASGVPYWARDEEHIEKAFDFGGVSARNAIAAGMMVSDGFTAVDDALSGSINFFTIFSTQPKPQELVDGLGTRFEIMDATIKKWSVGSPIQAALDAVMALIGEHKITSDEIENIVATLPDDRANVVDNRSMANICLQHLVAVAFVDRGLSFETAHDDERMMELRVADLRSRVKLVPSAELSAARPPRQAILEVTTKTRGTFRHHTRMVKGTPANPMTRQEVVDKARDLIAPITGAVKAQKLIDLVLDLEQAPSVMAFRPLLQPE